MSRVSVEGWRVEKRVEGGQVLGRGERGAGRHGALAVQAADVAKVLEGRGERDEEEGGVGGAKRGMEVLVREAASKEAVRRRLG
eukprot:3438073-Rhodomonas_salina.1